MSIRMGITGGIGSGKSIVSRLLRIMGIPVYLTDDEAKRLTSENENIRHQLIQLVGAQVYDAQNRLNRRALADYLFANEQHAQQINAIIHPCVKQDFQNWCANHRQHPIVAVESAILLEAGFENVTDHIVMVYAPTELRLKRAMHRDHANEGQIRKRMEQQMSDEEKCHRAHSIIYNDENSPLIPQVRKLLMSLKTWEVS